MNNYIKYILRLVVVAIAAFLAHMLILKGIDADGLWSQTGYTLSQMYSFCFVSSVAVVVLTLLAQWSMPKNLGFIFLGLVVIQAIASYIYIKDGLNKFENDFIEYNFLATFFVFLFFEVYVALSALNEGNMEA